MKKAVLGFLLVGFCMALATFASTHSPMWSVSPENLKNEVSTLAQPAWEGRLAGSQGSAKAREWIKGQFKNVGLTTIEQPLLNPFKKVIGTNLIVEAGIRPEDAPDHSCVMIGAHYDHLGLSRNGYYPGADDNASGVAVILEMARLVQDQGNLPGCLILVAWDFEEGNLKTGGGIKGSKFFVKHPLFPLSKIGLSLTFDLLGGSMAQGIEKKLFVFGSELNAAFRERLKSLPLKADLEIEPISTKVIEPFGSLVPRSDYGALRDQGVPYLFFSTGTSHDYHRETDTPEKLQYGKLASITESILNLIWPYVSRETKLETLIPRPAPVSEVAAQDLKITQHLLEVISKDLVQQNASRDDQDKISKMLNYLNQFSSPSEVRTCELQSAFFRILEVDHVKAPIPPRLIRFLLFCPI